MVKVKRKGAADGEKVEAPNKSRVEIKRPRKGAKSSRNKTTISSTSTKRCMESYTVSRENLDSTIRRAKKVPFLAPASSTLFPPTIYSNVVYSHGICLSCDGSNMIVPSDYMIAAYGNVTFPYSPLLSQPDIWSHKYSAEEASKQGFPLPIYRRLGTITRTIVADGPPPERDPTTDLNSECRYVPKRQRITPAQAKRQALLDMPEDYTETELQEKVKEIQLAWDSYWNPDPIPKLWDQEYGHLHPHMVNDPSYVPLQRLVCWEHNISQEVLNLYHGIRTVRIDNHSLFKALAELQSPRGLYHTPLILTYPRLTNLGARTFLLQIGVYCHRLAAEVLYEQDLLTIMSALDSDSYITIEPIHIPPIPLQPTFASAPLPELVFHEVDTDTPHEKEPNSSSHPIDLTLGESSREVSDVLSAFSIPGLLKIWENTGNDISEWPLLEPELSRGLTMPLLCHQIHALCWMRQMETLGGLGLNSILWEERQWEDGGKYYYSPALGQLRLVRPATMHGGILADEMGLGKTIMLLALILTTINDLKRAGPHTTLIVVPPALLWQWRSEIIKAAPQLTVQLFSTNSGNDNVIPDHDIDIVLTTYQTLEQVKTSKCLQQRSWGRIVLDEMQNIRSSTTTTAKRCDKLKCQRRWMLSGTPLFDGIDDLKGELNFLSLEPYAAKSEDGFFQFSISNRWNQSCTHGIEILKVLGLLLLRRSKSMSICETGSPLMGLKPLTVEFVAIPQTKYERALYCFLEYIVALHLQHDEYTASHHRTCLKMLRELCISPMLISGGLGASSAIPSLNHLMIICNRKGIEVKCEANAITQVEDYSISVPNIDVFRPEVAMSCEDAIRYLSQLQSKVQTSDDFVSDLHLGAGGGGSKRIRAVESIEDRQVECKEIIRCAEKEIQIAQTSRARSYWHLALEHVTTGQLHSQVNISHSIQVLWKWRRLVLLYTSCNQNQNTKLPVLLARGWRPSVTFTKHVLPKKYPDFGWNHQSSLMLINIPTGVQLQDLSSAISTVLGSEDFKIIPKGKTKVILRFYAMNQLQVLFQHARKGIDLKTEFPIPFLANELSKSQSAHNQAKWEDTLHPTFQSRKSLKETLRRLEAAQRGLLITFDNKSNHIHLVRAVLPIRSLQPSYLSLVNKLHITISDTRECLMRNRLIVQLQEKKIKNLMRGGTIPDNLLQSSAFESLESMALNEYDATSCVICMGYLGSSDSNCVIESVPGLVALTSCGHLFCKACISDYIENRRKHFQSVCCPTCRKDISQSPFVVIDPSLTLIKEQENEVQRAKAKELIAKVAEKLDKSNGCLDMEMWLQLFLSIDIPKDVSQRGDPRFTAIPKEVISFFRAATCFSQVHNKPRSNPNLEPFDGLSSKMKQLLCDLPLTERSIIFTSSRSAIKHLVVVLEYNKICHRSVFSGQSSSEAERAVQEWKEAKIPSTDCMQSLKLHRLEHPLVLIVQAGAAASGLTLTAACKMFFLEPFVCYEEEQQAYARCHRYGQTSAAHARVYFTPVTVESRLLEWRKQASLPPSRLYDTKMVYTDLLDLDKAVDKNDHVIDIDQEYDDIEQTRFLLGLQ